MDIKDKIAVITGAGSGIGKAVAHDLARRSIKALALVDRNESINLVAQFINGAVGSGVHAEPFMGDVIDEGFRREVYDQMISKYGVPSVCIPAAGVTRDGLAAKMDKQTGKAIMYPLEQFHQVIDVNLVAPVYWGLEMVCRIAEDRFKRGLKR